MIVDPAVVEALSTPPTWFIYELASVIFFLYCVKDLMVRYEGNDRFVRFFELIGYVFYAALFENLGVMSTSYNYSLHRFMKMGVIPLSVPLIEASIFYTAMLFAELLNFRKWVRPFIPAFLGALQDFTIDPVAIADKYDFGGVSEGRWTWDPTIHYADAFFGIPYFNFNGWYLLMFYYAMFVIIGRTYYEKKGKKLKYGVIYVILAALISDIMLATPITFFLLFTYPFIPQMYGNRTREIIMLAINSAIIIGVILSEMRRTKRTVLLRGGDKALILGVPIALHALDLLVCLIRGLWVQLIPVFIFSALHFAYLLYYTDLGAINQTG